MNSENWTGVFSDIHGKSLPARQFLTDEIVDAAVIRTGAGGAPLLSRLAKAGLKVVALEAGSHWSTNRDFVTDEPRQSKLFWAGERLSSGKNALAFGNNNSGIRVGGFHFTLHRLCSQTATRRF